jgi:hypothetical protein
MRGEGRGMSGDERQEERKRIDWQCRGERFERR